MNQVCGINVPDEFFAKKILEGDGIFDRPSFDMCMKHVKGRGTALDVGAHYGTWSIGFAKAGFSRVVAFEPVKKTFKILAENTKNYKEIELYNYGVADKQKNMSMASGKDNTGQYHVDQQIKGGLTPFICIDDMAQKHVELIKIDVEGYEYFALKGAENTIKRQKPILCIELNGLSTRYKTHDCTIIKMLYDWGYRIEDIENKDYLFKHRDA